MSNDKDDTSLSERFKTKPVLLFIILADMLFNVAEHSFEKIAIDHGDFDIGVALVSVFVVTYVIFFLLYIGYVVYLLVVSCMDIGTVLCKGLISVVEVVGVTLYFYGDNVEEIASKYANRLSCSKECTMKIHQSAIYCMTFFLFLNKFVLSGGIKLMSQESNKGRVAGRYVIGMISSIAPIDAVYTIILTLSVDTREYCGSNEKGIAIFFLVMILIFQAAIVFKLCLKWIAQVDKGSKDDKVKKYSTPIGFGIGVCVLIISVFHLLADNYLPLDCAFNCDSYLEDNFNETENSTTGMVCNEIGNANTRLALSFLSLLGTAIISAGILIRYTYMSIR